MADSAVYLFVYGTLRRDHGHPMHRVLARQARLLGPGWVAGKLYDLGAYPALVRPAGGKQAQGTGLPGKGADWVRGELYRLRGPDAVLCQLDRYEGCAPESPPPREYQREPLLVLRPGGNWCTAWGYVYARPRPPGVLIRSGDYLRR